MIPFLESRESIERLLHNYVNYLNVERHTSPYTMRNYHHDLRRFLEFLHEEKVATFEEVDRLLLRRYIETLIEQGLDKTSIAGSLFLSA